MTLNAGRLKRPITVDEIGKCIGSTSKDVGTLVLHPNVQMWSRKKPVHNTSPHPTHADWWKGVENNCGIKAPNRVSTFAAVKALYDGGLNGWSYIKPTTWYRMLDFDGYYHYATPQITGLHVPEKILSNNNVAASVDLREPDLDADGSGSLDMKDITVDGIALSDWYLGMALFENGNNLIGWIATSKGVETQQIEYPVNSGMIGKEYTLVPFYSKVKLTKDSGNSVEGALISLPNLALKKVKVVDVNTLLSIEADAQWAANKASISFTLLISNNSGDSLPVTSSYARLMEQRSGLTTADQYWALNMDASKDYGIELNISSVPKDGLEKAYTQSIGSNNNNKTYVLLVRLVSGGNNYDQGPEEVNYETEES